MPKRLTTEEFIRRAKLIHGDKYDYSLVEYKSNKKFVKIICPIHGVFEQRPLNHLQGCGCQECYGNKKLTTELFIKRAKEIHGDKYDYSLVEYTGDKNKVKIICPVHGVFEQLAFNHLKGSGCKKCSRSSIVYKPRDKSENKNRLISKCKDIHNNKYDYSLVEYTGTHNKVKIICPIHGIFEQSLHDHSKGYGCPKCAIETHKEKTKKTNEKFIQQAREVHGDKYDYSKINYINNYTPIEIICPEHGSFFQNPKQHLRGYGCIQCGGSISEKEIALLLKNNNIMFSSQKKFEWLKYRKHLLLDFFLPDYNIAIECQGRQHFESVDWFNGDSGYKLITKRDKKKKELCEAHGIKILYYANYKYDFPYKVYTDKDELLNEILNSK